MEAPDQIKTIRGGKREHVLIDPDDPMPGIKAGRELIDRWEAEVSGKKGGQQVPKRRAAKGRKK